MATELAPAPGVALLTSAEAWRGSGVSFVNIARGLTARGYRPHAITVCDAVTRGFRDAEVPVTQIARGRGEVPQLRRALHAMEAEVLMVDRPHDLRVGARAVFGRRAALVNRYNLSRSNPPTDVMTRAAYLLVVRETLFLTAAARDRVLAQAPFMRRVPHCVINEGVDVERVRPSDADALAFRRAHDLGDRPFLLAVGALSLEKRVGFLLDAVALLGDDALPLIICGVGSEESSLRERAASLGVDARFVGFLGARELRGAYSACVALVHACAVETFGLAVLEAMACSRPVVACTGGAAPEVVGDDGQCGTLVPADSPAAMADALRGLLRAPERAAAMGERGRARAAHRFSLDAMADGYAALVGRHVAPRAGAARTTTSRNA